MDGYERTRSILDQSGDRKNPGPREIMEIFAAVKTIAVVGISRNPEKAARLVPAYLATKGYEIIPVNPFVDQVLGKRAVDSLADVVGPVDMVLVFRPSEEAAVVAESALARPEHPVIWLQEGIRADEVAARARARGIRMVQDLCASKIHKSLPAE